PPGSSAPRAPGGRGRGADGMAATASGYSHVAISVTDLDAARDFYCDVLGFEVLPRPDFGFPGLWLRVGSLQLHLAVADERVSAGPGFPHFALFLPTDQFHPPIQPAPP